MTYTVSSNFLDIKWNFKTKEQAEEKIRQLVADDKVEFGEDTTDDYYIVEEN